MEGKNVLPHVKQAVAAYDASSILSCCSNVVCEIKSFKSCPTHKISVLFIVFTQLLLWALSTSSVLEIYFIHFVLANN